jgi:NAD(P)-dependent dehydrogenase (short-subunit alcohol dehydrogenase family)
MADEAYELFGLAGRVALVTGATKGVGQATADVLAAAGTHVVLTSRHEEEALAAADALQKKYQRPTLGVACDITHREQVKRLFKRIDDWGQGPLQVLVNNAGHPIVDTWWDTPLHQMAETELEKAIAAVAATDLHGSRWCTYYALPRMLKRKKGSIVFTASTPAIAGYKGLPYTEAKAAILGLMKDTARAYGPMGVRANAIAPGNIRTAWLDELSTRERKLLEKENPLRRFGEPREVAHTILFLASDMSSFITGETLIVDGGTVIR